MQFEVEEKHNKRCDKNSNVYMDIYLVKYLDNYR